MQHLFYLTLHKSSLLVLLMLLPLLLAAQGDGSFALDGLLDVAILLLLLFTNIGSFSGKLKNPVWGAILSFLILILIVTTGGLRGWFNRILFGLTLLSFLHSLWLTFQYIQEEEAE